MRLVKYIWKNKVLSTIIAILITLFIIMGRKYNSLRNYVNDTIYIESWKFASNNFVIIELLENDEIEQVDEEKISKFYYEMYEEYNEICRAYGMLDVSGKSGTFDNRLADKYNDLKRSEILKIHKIIDEVLIEHKVSYKDLEKYMHSENVHYNQLLVEEWKKIINELNLLDF
ncbi:hypothetical protein SH2C18_31660 [Clostridium sediminicola]|uniref:hypothetical protein n=1 Tax=Clostridium sediminicola TaxID=3114879 RepID=UPI0031F27445